MVARHERIDQIGRALHGRPGPIIKGRRGAVACHRNHVGDLQAAPLESDLVDRVHLTQETAIRERRERLPPGETSAARDSPFVNPSRRPTSHATRSALVTMLVVAACGLVSCTEDADPVAGTSVAVTNST